MAAVTVCAPGERAEKKDRVHAQHEMAECQADDLRQEGHHHAAEQQPDAGLLRAERKIGPA